MVETLAALLFAHLLGDFVFQSDAMVRHKRRPLVLAAHGGIHAALAWCLLGFPLSPVPILVLTLSHIAIDRLKVQYGKPGFRAFAADQAAHLVVILAIASFWPDLWGMSFWAGPAAQAALPGLDEVPRALAVGAGLVAAVWAGSHAVAALMQGVSLPPDPAEDGSLPQGGRLIGQLERFIILILVLAGETVGIGLLIAAKSILRFGEIQKDRQVAEYVIIGTLASFGWALAVALATVWLLARL